MVHAKINYLDRDDLYLKEKPYSVELKLEDSRDVPGTNYISSSHKLDIQALGIENNFDLDTHGFCTMRASIDLDAEVALVRPKSVEESYTARLAEALLQHLPQYRRLELIDFVIRKRDSRFPSDQFGVVSHLQPTALAHADYSTDGGYLQLAYTFPGQDEYFRTHEFDMINVWKPLIGPNDDWPLAVCDSTTVDVERDIISADILYSNHIGEGQLLHFNPDHTWYYIPQQQPDDLLIFRNADSTSKRPVGFHTAFENPDSTGPPRQSCEIRFVALRK